MNIDKKYVENIANQIKQKINTMPEIAMILGSGLSEIVNIFSNKIVIKYEDLNGMIFPSVSGHKNQFVIGNLGNKTVIAMQGRFHPYNGFNAKECVFPLYIFKLLGVKTCIITNSAGAINKEYIPGDLMLIKDHINFTGMNPLIGGPIIDYGEEFVDLKHVYDKDYIKLMKNIGIEKGVNFKEGVFVQDLGPSYESPAEVIMYRTIGGDSVSMSTVLEVIAAAQCKMKVLGISCIANKAVSLDNPEELTHEEVLKVANEATEKLKICLTEFINRL